MSKSIAELRASTRASLPRDQVPVCVAQGVVSDVEALAIEKTALERDLSRLERADETKPRKMAEGRDPGIEVIESRIAEIDQGLEALYDEMREHTGMVTLQAVASGDWRRWADDHPPREDKGTDDGGRPGLMVVDVEVGRGYVNATALIARLGDFVKEWNGDPITAEDWEWLAATAAPGDLKSLARRVVEMHEGEGKKALPKSSTGSSSTSRPATS